VGPSLEILFMPSEVSSIRRAAVRSMGEGVEGGDEGENKGGYGSIS
jgi:hypothetical protein